MGDIDKARSQRDAQRTVASRRTGSSRPERAILRYLGVELYKEHRRDESGAKSPDAADADTGDAADGAARQ